MSISEGRSQGKPAVTDPRPNPEPVRTAQTGLLYDNASTGLAVTLVAVPLLSYFEWQSFPHHRVLAWMLYMLGILAGRLALNRRHRRVPGEYTTVFWSRAFSVGAGLAGIGWGLAGAVFHPEAPVVSQVFPIFLIGGMMLGGASLLASRPEAFAAFLFPAGIIPAVHLVLEGKQEHVLMGLLAALFTAALFASTWRLYRTVESVLRLQVQNQDLVGDLRAANEETRALNQALEIRVSERTAELLESTRRLKAEIEQRQKTEEELLRVRNLESLGVLAGGIAHDLNNFLTVVHGNIELAKMSLDAGSPAWDLLSQTESACQRAGLLSSQLLTFAKGGAPIRSLTSIAKLVKDAIQLARAGAPVSVAVEIAEDLWSAEADGGQIVQALYNVLLNAKQAVPEGGIVEVRAQNLLLEEEGNSRRYVRISIRDYGPGIPAEILPKVFDPYFTTKAGGSGLGLATAFAILSRHGGRISADSEPGEGAVFTIDLPACLESSQPEHPADARRQSGSGRILVMDDEEAVRTLLVRMLRSLGYEAKGARDGAETIHLWEQAVAAGSGFDVILLDLTVGGGMGGIETAAKLREMGVSAKLVVSSGYSDAPVMSRFKEYGFDAMLPKPWDAAQLSEVISRVLAADADRRTS